LVGLLEGGPINCLVLDESAAPDGAVAEAARKAGLLVRPLSSLGVAPLADVKWSSPAPVVALSGLVWPSIKAAPRDSNAQAEAGPTGAPWIDSNCWVVRLARVRAPGKSIWLEFAPPADEVAPNAAALSVAIADSAAAGARWIVSLGERLSKGLAGGNADAVKDWRGMMGMLRFFEKHREWAAYEPWGSLGVLSTFSGENDFMGKELLNLAARRNLLYRILDRSGSSSQSVERLKAILYVDSERPSPEWKARLTAFGRGGGLLIAPRALAGEFPGEKPLPCPVVGYDLRAFGKGSVASPTRDWDDPYFLAADVHNLVSRRNDPVTLFNARSLWEHYSVAPGGRSELLQLVGFTGRSTDSVSIAVARPFASAAMYVPEQEAPVILKPEKVDGRQEYHLPSFLSYAALEFKS
jgi:hypothetical protein